MSVKHSIRSSASPSGKDRLNLCTFTFSDGRRCRALRLSGHPQFCHFHARREAEARAAEQLGRDAGYFLSGGYLSACDLSAVLGRLFAEVAAGRVKPSTAATLAYLAQVLVQTIRLAENEYIAAFDSDAWRRIVSSHVRENAQYLNQQRASLAPPSPPPAPVTKPRPSSPPPVSAAQQVRPAPPPSAKQPQPQHPTKDANPERAQRVQGFQSSATTFLFASPAHPQPTIASPVPPAKESQPASKEFRPASNEPRSTGPTTGPSGLPVLAPLPPKSPDPSGLRST